MSLANIYKTLCDGLGLAPVNGSYVQALGDYFGVVDNPNRRYDDEVLVQALINSGGPGTSEVLIFDTFTDFPLTGNDDSLYVTKDTNVIYRWDSTSYQLLNSPTAVNPDEVGTSYFVDLATTGALNACTYNNGTSGVTATLTGNVNGQLSQVSFVGKIDNVATALGQVILVKSQSGANKKQNGIYEVTTLGNAGTPFVLTRIVGFDATDEIYPSTTFVSQGSTNKSQYFTEVTVNPVVGTDDIVFAAATVSLPQAPIRLVDTVLETFPTSTYTSGTAFPTLPGLGATLEKTTNGALGVVNGVNMTSGKIILINFGGGQAYRNGTYQVTNAGSATSKWKLTRLDYYQNNMGSNIKEIYVSNVLSTYYGSRYSLSTPNPIVATSVGTPGYSLVFTKTNNVGLIDGISGTITIADSTGASNLVLTDLTANIIAPSHTISNATASVQLSLQGSGADLALLQANDGTTNGFLQIDSPNATLDLYSDGDMSIEGVGSITLNSELNTIAINPALDKITITANDGSTNGFLSIEGGSNGVNLTHDTYLTLGTDNGNNGIEFDGANASMYTVNGGEITMTSTNGVTLKSLVAAGNGFSFKLTSLPVYASDVAAGVGGLTTNMVYKTSTGELRIKI